MAEANPKVQAMVERELKKNPDITGRELREKAVKIDSATDELSGRQFHAKYALPVRRRLSGPKRRKKAARRGRKRGPARDGAADPVINLLEASFREKKAAFDGSIEDAFRRAIEADSVSQVNKLLSWIERQTRALQSR